MDANQFFFWLRGFAEITGQTPTDKQWEHIRTELFQTTPTKPLNIPVMSYPGNNSGGCSGCAEKSKGVDSSQNHGDHSR